MLWLAVGGFVVAIATLAVEILQYRRQSRAHFSMTIPTEEQRGGSNRQAQISGAEEYTHATGRFERRADGGWDEYDETGQNIIYRFEETSRDGKYLYLVDRSRRKDPGRPFTLRLPLAGGIAQWSYPNPYEWSDVTAVRTVERASGNVQVTIAHPIDGARVPHAVAVDGTVSALTAGSQLWIVKEPLSGVFHSDRGPVTVEDGKFHGTAYIGNATPGMDTGHEVKIHIVECSITVGQVFNNHVVGAETRGVWVGLPSLMGAQILATVSVVRDDSAGA